MLYLVTFLFIGTVVTFSTSCPDGWRQSDIIANKCYLIVTNKKNWFDAENYCKSAATNGHLTSITSAFEQANVNAIVSETQSSSICDNMWIGANDIQQISAFTWTDGMPFSYMKWKPGQPDSSPDKLCVAAEARSSGFWNTNDCGDEFCFICESNNQLPSTIPPTSPVSTPSPTLPPNSPCKNLDILFLIDESQSMHINNGFEAAKSFILNFTDTYKVIPDVRFAWITFNSKIWVQTPFMAAQDFKANVMNTNFNEGSTNFVLGFNAANYMISTYSGPSQQRQAVIIFVSDGNPNDGGGLDQVIAFTKHLRCYLNTRIIGLGVSEALTNAQTMKDAIGVGALDNCTESHYGDISNYAQIPIAGLPQVEQYLNCFSASIPTCNLDIMFVFENSELVNYTGRFLELGAMTQTISDYGINGNFNLSGDHLGIVFFSSAEGFNGAEYSRSGILDDPANNNTASFNYAQALSLLNNFNYKYQLGGASDVLLGLTMTSELLAYRQNVDKSANIPAIIIMGRGTFHDADNCCDSPIVVAQNLRAQYGAQMKGVLKRVACNRLLSTALLRGQTAAKGRAEQQIESSFSFEFIDQRTKSKSEIRSELISRVLLDWRRKTRSR
uniref:Uncharacterized protein n=1 Tax=Plectus sambesii TaxID=2011161 RepID=A0A914UQX3_9BILA